MIFGGVEFLSQQVSGLALRVRDLKDERDTARAERNALLRHLRDAHSDSWRPGRAEIGQEIARLHLTETMDPIDPEVVK